MPDRTTTTRSQAVTPAAALLTPEGRGALATVRIHGDRKLLAGILASHFRTPNNTVVDQVVIGRVLFGHWGITTPEGVVICRVDEITIDVHCHGGTAAPRRILNDLQRAGVGTIPAAKLQHESIGRFRVEILESLCAARTLRTANIVLEQSHGLLENTLQKLMADVNDPSFRNSQGTEQLVDRFDSLLRFARFGRHLTEPWRVVLTGRPNVGKSSLLNALAGYSRSIVFDQPGTTRDVLTAETAFDGWPIELIDTAGIRESRELLEANGIERARSILQSADCRVLLLDVSQPLTKEDDGSLRSVAESIVIAHKSDLSSAWDVHEISAQYGITMKCVSTKTDRGLDELQAEIVRRLVPEVPPPGTPIPVSPRQIELLQDARESVSRGDDNAASRSIAWILV